MCSDLLRLYFNAPATKCSQIGYVTRAVYSRISHRKQPTPPVTVYKTEEHLGRQGESY